jgi:hypothetical protein
MKRYLVIVALMCAVVVLASCAPGPNPEAGGPDAAGFWTGLWQGFTILFTFIWSLFNDQVSIYEVANNGGWYDFGFLLGVMCFWGGGTGGAAGASRR